MIKNYYNLYVPGDYYDIWLKSCRDFIDNWKQRLINEYAEFLLNELNKRTE